MSTNIKVIKQEILSALSHPEAENGLYFSNLYVLHEEEERPAVSGTQVEILDALKDLIQEGKISADESGHEVRFILNVA